MLAVIVLQIDHSKSYIYSLEYGITQLGLPHKLAQMAFNQIVTYF